MKVAAIYSRKSIFTGKGESIENQIELCKQYGKSLNITEYLEYEDEGASGKNTNRKNFQRLLQDAKEKKFDVLICYKLDRISRNVSDFSATLDMLRENDIDFISITEKFDTSTPVGRAMVYIASVFAQLERETIAERVRDNMLQLAKTGRWLGGQEPYGFKSEKVTYIDEELNERSLMKLIPVEEELELVKFMYSRYLEIQSITQVVKHLNLTGYRGKNGGEWSTMQLKRILSNPLYVKSSPEIADYLKDLGINVYGTPNGNGYITYNKTERIVKDRDMTEWIAAIGKHPGVINHDDWIRAQKVMDKNKDKKLPRIGTGDTTALLTGLLKCSKCGSNMRIKSGHKSRTEEGVQYNYYVCSAKDSSYGTKCNNSNIRIDRLDKLVIQELKAYNHELLVDELSAAIENEMHGNSTPKKIEDIKEDISENEKAINNLVKQLSLNSNEQVAKYILNEIEKLTEKINKLQDRLLSAEEDNKNITDMISNTQIVLDAIARFNNEYDAIENIQHKRNLLRSIINKITWDGIDNKFKIHLFTGDDSKKK